MILLPAIAKKNNEPLFVDYSVLPTDVGDVDRSIIPHSC